MRLSEHAPAYQWACLITLSVGLGALLASIGVPAALLLGPLLSGIAFTALGGEVRLPRRLFVLAQALIGCMIAKMLPTLVAGTVVANWEIFALGVLSVIGASAFLGWLMTRLRVLPGTTLLWGLSPGAATAMTLMAEAYGADVQLVALMQYLRVVMVAAVASIVARIWGTGAYHRADLGWFPPLHALSLAQTLTLAILGVIVASRLHIRAGALLFPLVAGVVLTHSRWMTIDLPPWLLALAYALVGWRIGLRFKRSLLLYAARALPRILACTTALIALCGGLAALLVLTAGIDPLTAYLATSPGGADTVAIIAASSHVDAHFVMAMQTARLVTVLILGPPLARLLVRHTEDNRKLQHP